MANVEKFGKSQAWAILAHDTRTKAPDKGYKNPDIDPTRTCMNWSLIDNSAPDSAYNRLKQRLSEVKLQNRADVKILCSWVVTLPEDVKPEDERKFFTAAFDFICNQYGRQNLISADVHYDESRPHLHCTFVPVVANTRKSRSEFGEKVSAKEVLTRQHLLNWHKALSEHVEQVLGYPCSVITHTTKKNRSIAALKASTEVQLRASVAKQEELTQIAEQNAKEAIEVHKKAEALAEQNKAMEAHLKRLSARPTARKQPGMLGNVKLSAEEYKQLCDKADAATNIISEKKLLTGTVTGQRVESLNTEVKTLREETTELAKDKEQLQKKVSILEKNIKNKKTE